jgi:hypothetical protein
MKIRFRKTGIGLAFLVTVIQICFSSCVPDPDDLLECPYPSLARLDSIYQVFYSPYTNQRYASQNDTVRFEDFLLNVEFGYTKINTNSNAIDRTYPGACASLYNVQNLSNIELYLTSPYNGLPTGTEVSYLFLTPDGTALNRFRDFKRMNQYFSLKLKEKPTQKSQINTRLVVYFRDGSSKSIASISPFLK